MNEQNERLLFAEIMGKKQECITKVAYRVGELLKIDVTGYDGPFPEIDRELLIMQNFLCDYYDKKDPVDKRVIAKFEAYSEKYSKLATDYKNSSNEEQTQICRAEFDKFQAEWAKYFNEVLNGSVKLPGSSIIIKPRGYLAPTLKYDQITYYPEGKIEYDYRCAGGFDKTVTLTYDKSQNIINYQGHDWDGTYKIDPNSNTFFIDQVILLFEGLLKQYSSYSRSSNPSLVSFYDEIIKVYDRFIGFRNMLKNNFDIYNVIHENAKLNSNIVDMASKHADEIESTEASFKASFSDVLAQKEAQIKRQSGMISYLQDKIESKDQTIEELLDFVKKLRAFFDEIREKKIATASYLRKFYNAAVSIFPKVDSVESSSGAQKKKSN